MRIRAVFSGRFSSTRNLALNLFKALSFTPSGRKPLTPGTVSIKRGRALAFPNSYTSTTLWHTTPTAWRTWHARSDFVVSTTPSTWYFVHLTWHVTEP